MSSASRLGVGADRPGRRAGPARGSRRRRAAAAARTSPASSSASRSIAAGAAAEPGVRRVLVLLELARGPPRAAPRARATRLSGSVEAAAQAGLLAGELAQAGVDGGLVVAAAAHDGQRGAGRPQPRAAAGGRGAAGAPRGRRGTAWGRAACGLRRRRAVPAALPGPRRPVRRAGCGLGALGTGSPTGITWVCVASPRAVRGIAGRRCGSVSAPVPRASPGCVLGVGLARDIAGSPSSSKMDSPGRSCVATPVWPRPRSLMPPSLADRRRQPTPASRVIRVRDAVRDQTPRKRLIASRCAAAHARRRGRRGPPRAPGRARRPCPGGRCGARRARPGRRPRAGRSCDRVGWIMPLAISRLASHDSR